MKTRVMWDLCSGLEGASAAFKARGWRVVTVDNNPIFKPTLLRDLAELRLRGEPAPDFVWASPPCTEYALRRFDPTIVPSLNLVVQARRLIRDLRPRYWALENVRHSVPYISSLLGPHRLSVGPFFLWGNFPKFLARPVPLKGSPGGPHWLRGATRAKIPLSLSEDMEAAVTYMLEQEAAHQVGQEPALEPAGDRRSAAAQEPKAGRAGAPGQEPRILAAQGPAHVAADLAQVEPAHGRAEDPGLVNRPISQRYEGRP